MNVKGSVALVSNNRLENRRAQMKEAHGPIAIPTAIKSAPCSSTSRKMSC